MMRRLVLPAIILALTSFAVWLQPLSPLSFMPTWGVSQVTCAALPFTFTNGTVADATQVNSVATALRNCINNANYLPRVASNAALKAVNSTAYPAIVRAGFTVAGDAEELLYIPSSSPCSLNAGSGDNASQVKSADGKCFNASFPTAGADIREWGCVPDDSTDIVPCLASAYAANVGPIKIPSGVWRVASATTFAAQPPDFRGNGWKEFNQNAACPTTSNVEGTWFHRVSGSSGITPFTISATSAQGNGGFKSIAFCEDHPTPGVSWAPTVYNQWFAINNVGGELVFSDDYLFAVYQFINYQGSPGGGSNGRLSFNHIRGQVFSGTGGFLFADYSLDVIHGNDIHLWPFWSNNTNVLSWQNGHSVPIELERVDGITIPDLFINSAKTGVLLGSSSNGSTIFASFPSYYCDACVTGLEVTGANTVAQIGALYIGGGLLTGSAGIVLDGGVTGAQVMVDSFHCASVGGDCVNIATSNGSNSVQIASAWIHDYNHDNNGSSAFYANTNNYIKVANNPTIGGSNNSGAVVPVPPAGYYEIPMQLTWTPGVAGQSTAGSASYSGQVGWYELKGNEVTVQFQINTTAFSGASGNTIITGLPYAGSVLAVNPGRCSITQYSGITFGTNYTTLTAEVNTSSSINLYELGGGATPEFQALPVSAVSATSVIGGVCTYRIL